MLNQCRQNYQVRIRKQRREISQSRDRQIILNCHIPQFKLLYFINKLRQQSKQYSNHAMDVDIIIQALQRAIQNPSAFQFNFQCLCIMLQSLLRQNNSISIIYCQILQYWFQLQTVTPTINQDNMFIQQPKQYTINRYLRVIKFLLKVNKQLSQYYFQNNLDNQIYTLFNDCSDLQNLPVLSRIIIITLQNCICQQRTKIKILLPNLKQLLFHQDSQIVLSSAKILFYCLRQNLIRIQGNLDQSQVCRNFVKLLQSQHFQLKCYSLKIIGQYIFKNIMIESFVKHGLFDNLMKCLGNSSLWIVKYIGWIIANFSVSQDQDLKSILVQHKLFIRLIQCYNSMNDKNCFSRTLQKQIFSIVFNSNSDSLNHNIIQTKQKQRIWIILIHFQMIDKIILNFNIKRYSQIQEGLQLFDKLIEMVFDFDRDWVVRIKECINLQKVKDQLDKYSNLNEGLEPVFQGLIFKVDKLLQLAEL